RLPDVVVPLLEAGQVSLPTSIILVGFDDYTPQQQEFLAALAKQGIELQVCTVKRATEPAVRVELVDVVEEMTLAARWARERLEHSPQEKIGVIVPQLESLRTQVIRIFDDIFHPEAILPGREGMRRVYNISLAQPLV